jgi:GcrA cell cycle regulator
MPSSINDFDWNTNTIAQLRTLWGEGHTTVEIGRRIGVSKNAIVGKAHRLKLPARPSPIRRVGVREPPAPRRQRGPTLPPLKDYPPKPSTLYQLTAVAVDVRRAQQDAAQQLPLVREAVPVCTIIRGNKPCCWPIGEPGTRAFRYCEAPNEAGKPYCPHHCGIAYQKKDQRQKQRDRIL